MQPHYYRTVILGAGVSGLSTAYALTSRAAGDVLVLEGEADVGGQCRTLTRSTARFDTGSHRIHDQPSPRAFALIRELCGDALRRHARGGKLRIRRGYIDYPITSFKMFLGLGLWESALCAGSLLCSTLGARFRGSRAASGDNYASYLARRAGRRGYRIFYEPYARKVWGCDPVDIALTAVKKRISMTRPTQILLDMWRHLRGASPQHYYYYVDGGIGEIPLRLAERVRLQGGQIVTGVRLLGIRSAGAATGAGVTSVVYAGPEGERTVTCDRLVSTIPLRELMAKLGVEGRLTCAPRQLTWRGLRFVALHLRGEPLLAGETFYFPELTYCFGRVSVPKRYTPSMLPNEPGVTTVLCEVPCASGDAYWDMPPDELIETCYRGLLAADFVAASQGRECARDFVFNLSGTYPIYYVGWQEAFQEALGLLGTAFPQVFTSGKQGLYLHCNLDHAMEIGLELAEHLDGGRNAVDWYARAMEFHGYRIRD